MPSGRFDEARDYAFADLALALRKRAGLTQTDLAALLQVSGQAIRAWEGGLSYPDTKHLEELIILYLERGALAVGREAEEAAAHASLQPGMVRRTVERQAPLRPRSTARAAGSTRPGAAGLGRRTGCAGGSWARTRVGYPGSLGKRRALPGRGAGGGGVELARPPWQPGLHMSWRPPSLSCTGAA